MKTMIPKPQEIDIAFVLVILPVRYGEEDIPNDFPLREGDVWRGIINIDTGAIEGWPAGQSGELSMKVCDDGIYALLDKDRNELAKIYQDYVPSGLIPDGGDYVTLKINKRGVIENWPKHPDVSRFFKKEDE